MNSCYTHHGWLKNIILKLKSTLDIIPFMWDLEKEHLIYDDGKQTTGLPDHWRTLTKEKTRNFVRGVGNGNILYLGYSIGHTNAYI